MYAHERSLVKRLADKPFALVGVNSDRDRMALKEVLKKENITWRSFWNGPSGTGGPISSAWGVRGWPTIYVLDHNGIIRFKNVRGEAMDKAVDVLLEQLADLPQVQVAKPKVDPPNVDQPKVSEWTDSTGKYKLVAEFVSFKDGEALFRKPDGKTVSVAMRLICKEDQQRIRDELKRRREK